MSYYTKSIYCKCIIISVLKISSYLGYWQHNLDVILVDVQPVSDPGVLGDVGRVDVLLQQVLVQVLVLDMPDQEAPLIQLRLGFINSIQPVEQLVGSDKLNYSLTFN